MIVFERTDVMPAGQPGPLHGRSVIVTGGSQGIGRGVAQVLAEKGASVAVCARSVEPVEKAAAELAEIVPALGIALDLAEKGAAKQLVSSVRERFGSVDSIVCCHGVFDNPAGNFLDFDEASFERTIEINLTSLFRCAQAAARAMVEDEVQNGRIVLVSSIDATAAELHCVGYNASKAGVIGLMRAIALDLAPRGITCNAILPGWVRSPMIANSLPAEVLDGSAPFDLTPTNLLGLPEDIGHAAAYFVDPANRYVTGASLVVDGGQTAALHKPGRNWA